MERPNKSTTKLRRSDQGNIENKENVDPLRPNTRRYIGLSNINSANNINNVANNIHDQNNIDRQLEQSIKDEPLSEKYKLLRKKAHRGNEDGEVLRELSQMNQLFPNAKKIFSFNAENSKFSFKCSPPGLKLQQSRKEHLRSRPERKMKLDIIKSHTKLYAINTKYVITERGIDCSQKTHNTQFISIGRQQVNDQGIRPNDIMLFPTDPSISRSHFKIYHKDYFDKQKSFEDTFMTMSLLTKPKLCQDKRFNCLNKNNIFDIVKYLCPKKKVAIEDNGTIYGTYVRVRPFEFPAFLENFLMTMKIKKNIEKISSDIEAREGTEYMNNFSLSKTLESYSANEYKSSSNDLFSNIYSRRNQMEEVFNDNFDYDSEYDRRIHTAYLNYLKLGRNYLNIEISESQISLQNNFVVDSFLPAVFLNNSKNGFNIIQIGNISEIIEALRNEYLAFSGEFFPTVELISLDKIFDCQKLDPSSQVYKAQITKEELVYIYQFESVLKDYSVLLLIETMGDPCGVMNRVNDVLFLSHKSGQSKNRRVFSFNFLKGFLLGNNPESSYHINSDVDAFLYYNSQVDKWMLTDLTRFLNAAIYYSQDYFGLWVCISSDKKASHRYSPEIFYVKSEDEIKVSETIMKLKLEDQ